MQAPQISAVKVTLVSELVVPPQRSISARSLTSPGWNFDLRDVALSHPPLANRDKRVRLFTGDGAPNRVVTRAGFLFPAVGTPSRPATTSPCVRNLIDDDLAGRVRLLSVRLFFPWTAKRSAQAARSKRTATETPMATGAAALWL